MARCLALLAVPALLSSSAWASPEAKPSAPRRILAVTAAVVPGFVLRGAGSFVVGDRPRTARRLATLGAIGLGAMVVAGIPLGVTGAPPVLTIPGVPILLAGAALYVPSWLADVWVAAGLDAHAGDGRTPPPYAIELGSSWVHDPFRDRALVRGAVRFEVGPVAVGTQGWVDPGGDDKLLEASASWRFHGEHRAATSTDDTTRYGVRLTARGHRDDVDDVTTLSGELEAWGRLDLVRLDPVLRGTFLDAAIGYGVERVGYARDAGKDEHDWNGLQTGRLAWGAYLLDRGELQIFYNHRRDDLVGGLPAYRASGFLGSVGTDVVLPVAGPWFVRGALEIGNAWVTTLALRYHGGLR